MPALRAQKGGVWGHFRPLMGSVAVRGVRFRSLGRHFGAFRSRLVYGGHI